MELADTNGDGIDEILAYSMTPGKTAMVTRILSVVENGDGSSVLKTLLEDRTSPPGYPLLGSEEQKPSVTFLQMASKDKDGLRRVYCWDGSRFEKCVEVVWKKP